MRIATSAVIACLPLAIGCGSRDSPTVARHLSIGVISPPTTVAPSCARVGMWEVPLPISDVPGGAVALAKLGEHTIAYVADEEDGSLRTIDVDTAKEIAVTTVGGASSAVLVLHDGRVVVTRGDKGEIAVLEPKEELGAPLSTRCGIHVAAEPTGIATTPDGATLLVVSRWGHTLAGFDAATIGLRFSVDLPRDPRAVVVSSDGLKAFVSHVVGARISIVDLDNAHAMRTLRLDGTERVLVGHMPSGLPDEDNTSIDVRRRRGGQGYAIVRGAHGRILASQVFTNPGNGIRSGSGGYGDDATVFGDVAPIEEVSERRTSEFHAENLGAIGCLLPRAAAFDARTDRLLVACLGVDRVVVYDASAKSPHEHERGRIQVGAGPTGIALDDPGRRAVVWSAFDQSITIVNLDAPRSGPKAIAPVTVALERRSPPLDADIARGRVLFHASGDPRISRDGRACASCHPEGRDDSITWTTENGPRQTPMLIERLEGTAPYGWDGAAATLPANLDRTLKRLSGSGLPESDRRALLAYVGSLRAPAYRGEVSSVATRGAQLFHSERTACASCQLGDEMFTDRLPHDVKSHRDYDFSVVAFDAPSLKFISRSAPYFHDGRYATLEELLFHADGTMGYTATLDLEDRDALLAYLESL